MAHVTSLNLGFKMGLHHGHDHKRDHSAERNMGRAFFLNSLFLVIETAGAFFSGSVAIWAGVIHDLGDSLTIGLSFFFEIAD